MIIAHEKDMLVFAARIANVVVNGTIIFLQGPLGAGKTTFARGFLQGLGCQEKVKSPTYTLVESYDISGKKFFHFDLYRLNRAEELYDIGIEEYFSNETICLIEWPEKGFPILPPADLLINIAIKAQVREINIQAGTLKGEGMINTLISKKLC
ncbi:MAG: tRNA (adenosine(37)-N6)-threonylcarbamoyltransferase complex ATPase subunit type 1 TsaE [Gammaproteobacteria bacterium RIFCSPHIGHO2_12_FULL_37_14]|nr:MAG: tRNA (adenosine(37)-N6)-threonylcarbamoyltransferase complex ATPase subunit type 1 TsaE [Gammaproteobacteria bacterium RIFCSPHIGHO2_12_FULL_37_14]